MNRTWITSMIAVALLSATLMSASAGDDPSTSQSKDYILGGYGLNPLMLDGDLCEDDPQTGGVFFCLGDTSALGAEATVTVVDASTLPTGGGAIWYNGNEALANVFFCGTRTMPVPEGADSLLVNVGLNPVCGPGTIGTVTVTFS